MLMNRRNEPLSSHTLARNPGYLVSRLSSTCLTVPASTSTSSAPDVNFLSGVGITTLSDIVNTSKCFFKCRKFGFDNLWRRQIQRLKGLEAVTGDSQHGKVIALNAALLDELPGDSDRHSAGRLGEDSLGLGEQPDTVDDFI